MSVPGDQQQWTNEASGLTDEEGLQQRIDAGMEDTFGDDDGKPSLEDFLSDPILIEKYADEEVQQIFNEIEEDPAKIADYKDNPKVKEVLIRICEIFRPHVNQDQQNPQPGGPDYNMQTDLQVNPLLQLMGGGIMNPSAQLYQGGEQTANQLAAFTQQMGNPMEVLNQLLQGQNGNPMEILNQLLQGQNPMANLASVLGGQGDAHSNEDQLAYIQELLRNVK